MRAPFQLQGTSGYCLCKCLKYDFECCLKIIKQNNIVRWFQSEFSVEASAPEKNRGMLDCTSVVKMLLDKVYFHNNIEYKSVFKKERLSRKLL